MPTPQDEEFLRFAVASRQLAQERADEALAALREVEALGGSAAITEILVNRDLLTQAQVDRLQQAIASSKAATKVPRELGGFELLEKLGQGAMGSVFRARQKELDRVVALKVLSPRLARSPEFVERFVREARSAGKLNHPNIVAAIDVGEDHGFYYFAMEFVDGETLAALLARERRLPERRALGIATDVARALEHAHQKGLIHRDIKPENIMVTADGRVRVTDFGLAKVVGQDTAKEGAERFLGTPAYVAPEQIRSEPDIDCRADLFSLGVTLFQMLSGERPFTGANAVAVAAAILAEPLPSLRKLAPGVSAATVRLVEKMTAKDRAERYATPAEALAALERAAAPKLSPRAAARPRGKARAAGRPAARPAARRPVARRRGSPVGAVLALVGGLAGAAVVIAVLVSRPRKPERPPPPPPVVSPEVTSRVSPADAAAQAALEQLRKAVADAAAFGQAQPRAYVSRLAALRKVRDDFAHTRHQLPQGGEALYKGLLEQLAALEQEGEAEAEADLQRRRDHVDALLREGKLAEALRVPEAFPAELRLEAVAPKVEQLGEQARRRVAEAFKALDDQGKQLIQQGRYERARELYLSAKGCELPKVKTRVERALSEVEQLVAERGNEAARVARQRYAATAKALVERLAARDYAAARKLLDAAIVDPELAPARERLHSLLPLVRAAAGVWARVEIGVKQHQAGDTIRVAGVGGQFIRFDGEKVHLRSGGAFVARPLTDLRTTEAVALARRGYGTPTPHHELQLALFLLADQDHAEARARLEALEAKGIDVGEASALAERLSPRTCATCKGEKAVVCPACGGKGVARVERKPCDACGGTGRIECSRCRGVGSLLCPICKGTGEAFRGIGCGNCDGRGRLKCPRCRGEGQLRCRKCNGAGDLTRATGCERCKGGKTVPCPDCGGRGQFPPPDLAPAPQE